VNPQLLIAGDSFYWPVARVKVADGDCALPDLIVGAVRVDCRKIPHPGALTEKLENLGYPVAMHFMYYGFGRFQRAL
jgi:hypothetical protein